MIAMNMDTQARATKDARELRGVVLRQIINLGSQLRRVADMYEEGMIGTHEVGVDMDEIQRQIAILNRHMARLELAERYAKEPE